jgi:hypothetical protein
MRFFFAGSTIKLLIVEMNHEILDPAILAGDQGPFSRSHRQKWGEVANNGGSSSGREPGLVLYPPWGHPGML